MLDNSMCGFCAFYLFTFSNVLPWILIIEISWIFGLSVLKIFITSKITGNFFHI